MIIRTVTAIPFNDYNLTVEYEDLNGDAIPQTASVPKDDVNKEHSQTLDSEKQRRPQSGSLRPYVSICKHMCTYGSCFLKDSCSKHPTNLPLTQSPLRAVPVIGKCEQGRRAQRKTVIGGDWEPRYPLQGDWDIWCYILSE